MAGWIAGELAGRLMLLWRASALFGVSLVGALPAAELLHYVLATVAAMPPAWLALRAVGPARFAQLATCGLAFAWVYLALLWLAGWLPSGMALGRRALARPTQEEGVARAEGARAPERAGL